MKIRTFSFLIVCVLLVCSCKNTKQVTQTSQPPELNSKTEITVRTERVKLLEPSNRAMCGYYVIIGSFRSIENARRYNIDLVKEGFTPEILENENGLFRISVGGFNEENAARAKITGIRAAYEKYNDVWLLVRK